MYNASSPASILRCLMLLLTTFALSLAPLLGAEDAANTGNHPAAALGSNAKSAAQTSKGPGTPARDPSGPAEEEPEEPDYAFITGGPYTQKENSIQFIFPTAWSSRRSNVAGSILQHAEYGSLLRTEWGLTDRWELDVIFSAEGERDRLGQQQLTSTFALADSVVGVRYRLLEESSAPITLATGPQVILPTGRVAYGTGNGEMGYAWDLAAAKDWGGPVFMYASVNYAFFPSVRPALAGTPRRFNLHNVFGATALVFRPLEKDRGPNHHDVHLFFEYGVGREEGLELDTPVQKSATTLSLFAPGIRYGFLTRKMRLVEIGVSFPIGLNSATPRYGVILQLQFEHLFRFGSD